MIPREKLGETQVPGGEVLGLFRRGGDFFITLGRNELMTSRMSGSEEALAELGCSGLDGPLGGDARVLIGGYGMGFTLRRALAVLGSRAEVTVAEIVPAILEWARGPMAGLTAGCLDDARTRVVEGDVAALIADGGWDAILLDVDNGPDGQSRAGNDRLYRAGGLAAARAAFARGRAAGGVVGGAGCGVRKAVRGGGLCGERACRAGAVQWQRSAARDLDWRQSLILSKG